MTALIQKLTSFMQQNGLDESALARKIGVGPSQVHRWVNGDTRPAGRNVNKVLKAVDGLKFEDIYPDLPDAAQLPTDEDDAAPADDAA